MIRLLDGRKVYLIRIVAMSALISLLLAMISKLLN